MGGGIKEHIGIGLFALCFSFMLFLGTHINVDNSLFTAEGNYISDYSLKELFPFIVLLYGVYTILSRLYFLYSKYMENHALVFFSQNIISWKRVLFISICLYIAWLPYLFVYSPGHIFGDTLNSILQILERIPLNNHHPVLYTLFIKGCFAVGSLFGDNTAGCIIYCIIQMSYMAFGFSCLINWICTKFGLRALWMLLLTVFYGSSPYIAQLSIAMWKDPVFSVTLMLFTILLADNLFSEDRTKMGRNSCIVMFLLLLLMAFSRNNGQYIIFLIAVSSLFFLIALRKAEKGRMIKQIGVMSLCVVILFRVISGSVYNRLGIIKVPAESYGVFLNQMASVVVREGNMSEEDRQYMAKLLPLELYETVYTPVSVDSIKRNENFNPLELEQGFFNTYFSMLVKNPIFFIEAWELETYGFWTVNREEINEDNTNFTRGVPRNYYKEIEDMSAYGIEVDNYTEDAFLTTLFPINVYSISIGIIAWIVIALLFLCIICRRWDSLLVLSPSFGLLLTLWIASPVSYWARYGAAVQFLVPLYLALFLSMKNRK